MSRSDDLFEYFEIIDGQWHVSVYTHYGWDQLPVSDELAEILTQLKEELEDE